MSGAEGFTPLAAPLMECREVAAPPCPGAPLVLLVLLPAPAALPALQCRPTPELGEGGEAVPRREAPP